MKIAIASDGKMVSGHFGHCEGFSIYLVKDDKIVEDGFLPNPGHRPGFLPLFLADQGVDVVISGGMGGGAIDILNEKGIKVVTGASGVSKEVAEKYQQGKLISTNSVCKEHQHAGECGEH